MMVVRAAMVARTAAIAAGLRRCSRMLVRVAAPAPVMAVLLLQAAALVVALVVAMAVLAARAVVRR
ncbi:hypothetical protein [Novosphingobium rosa]|uniref:hypothetical protein n=1 Tax=Novosphingobium rosa TaxID=76978 RepID=UPI00082AC6D8|nr:hypothetical protein [Novosphingobium rosa]